MPLHDPTPTFNQCNCSSVSAKILASEKKTKWKNTQCLKKLQTPVTFWHNFTNIALMSVILDVKNLQLILYCITLQNFLCGPSNNFKDHRAQQTKQATIE